MYSTEITNVIEMNKRPNLTRDISIQDFKDFYWLKEELMKFCKDENLKSTGNKIEISSRIETFILTGQISTDLVSIKSTSSFDWKNEKLSMDTKITDNYKNTENVRAFFKECVDPRFKFNVPFMNWMKSNSGKTLAEAAEEWKNIKSNSKNDLKGKEIAPQFEYNQYIRDFSKDNPCSKREVGIKLWKAKKGIRGNNVYSKDDFKLLE